MTFMVFSKFSFIFVSILSLKEAIDIFDTNQVRMNEYIMNNILEVALLS